jgi:plasmid maintenance system antidote protein VapI
LSTRLIVTKAELARLLQVTPARVSQWLKEGRLGPRELIGEGRHARIDLEKAVAKLKVTLDIVQAVANGRARLRPRYLVEDDDQLDLAYRRARVEAAEGQVRRLKEGEAERRGRYVRRADHDAVVAGLPSRLLSEFEKELPALAAGLALAFKVPQAEVEAFIRDEFEQIRRRAAERPTKESGQ